MTPHFVEEVIVKEKIDAITLSFGHSIRATPTEYGANAPDHEKPAAVGAAAAVGTATAAAVGTAAGSAAAVDDVVGVVQQNNRPRC